MYVRHKDARLPDVFLTYWEGDKLVPEDLAFYAKATISAVCIKVFQSQFLELTSAATGVLYKAQTAYVHLKCVDQEGESQIKVGLHLFPIMRFKKEFLPSKIDFYIKDENKHKHSVELPTKMAQNLLCYLNQGKPNLQFTCAQFADFLNGIYTGQLEEEWSSKYVLVPFDRNLLKTGDVVLFNGENDKPLHVAIYLRDNLYLWHSGGVCLMVSTYENIILCYSAKSANIAHPKESGN